MILVEFQIGGKMFISAPTSISKAGTNKVTVGWHQELSSGYSRIDLSYGQIRQALLDAAQEGKHLLDLTDTGVKELQKKYAHLRQQENVLKSKFGPYR